MEKGDGQYAFIRKREGKIAKKVTEKIVVISIY